MYTTYYLVCKPIQFQTYPFKNLILKKKKRKIFGQGSLKNCFSMQLTHSQGQPNCQHIKWSKPALTFDKALVYLRLPFHKQEAKASVRRMDASPAHQRESDHTYTHSITSESFNINTVLSPSNATCLMQFRILFESWQLCLFNFFLMVELSL